MKGFTHFLSAIAAASCLPGAAQQAAQGSLVLVLAGVAGLLPDTLDFKLARYLERADRVLGPEDGARAVAEELACAFHSASSGHPQTVRLRAWRVAHDRWRRYRVRFDAAERTLAVALGPLVDGGGTPVPGTDPGDAPARVRLPAALEYAYDTEIVVDVFAGPSLGFEPAVRRDTPLTRRLCLACAPHPVRLTFLPWHRSRTHSLVLAALAGLLAAALWGPPAGLAAALGYGVHVLEDQLGAMGSNLLWPFTRRRTPGLGLLRSGDAWPNVLTVVLATLVIIVNLMRMM
jgi:hypothetical protein